MPDGPMPLSDLREMIADDAYRFGATGAKHRHLRGERALNLDAMQTIAHESERRGKPMLADERRKFDSHMTAVELIDLELVKPDPAEERARQDGATRMAHPGVFGTGMGTWEREDREADQLRAFLTGEGPNRIRVPIRTAMREREMLRAGRDPDEVRALLWDTGSVGSGVPTLMARTLYEVLEANVAMLRMPTTKVPTETGANMDFPRLTTHTIGTQVIAQGTAIGGTDPAFLKTTFGAYKYGALIQVSSETIQDTAFDIASLIARDSGRAIGRLVDTDLVVGSGSGEPNGVFTAIVGAGTVATGGSLITPTYENLVDLAYSVNDSYRSGGNAAWLMRDSTAGTILKLRSEGGTVGTPLWQRGVGGIAGVMQPDTLLGWSAFTDPNVASMASNNKIIAFGDFSAYYVRHVGDIVLERDDSFAFDKDLTTFRAKWRVDGDLLDTAAINVLKQSV